MEEPGMTSLREWGVVWDWKNPVLAQMVCGRMLRRVELFHLEETAVSNASRWDRVCFIRESNKSSGWRQQGEGGREEWGKTKLKVSRNWNHPKKYASGEVSLKPAPPPPAPAWAHSLSSLRMYYNQPCLETTEVLQTPNTSQPDKLPLMKRWC